MSYVLIPAMLAVSFALAWAWWSGRVERDPVSSIDSFHRALDAMQPRGDADAMQPRGDAGTRADEHATPVP